jgi:uncharacterized protein YaiE (UPF0345 family)
MPKKTREPEKKEMKPKRVSVMRSSQLPKFRTAAPGKMRTVSGKMRTAAPGKMRTVSGKMRTAAPGKMRTVSGKLKTRAKQK